MIAHGVALYRKLAISLVALYLGNENLIFINLVVSKIVSYKILPYLPWLFRLHLPFSRTLSAIFTPAKDLFPPKSHAQLTWSLLQNLQWNPAALLHRLLFVFFSASLLYNLTTHWKCCDILFLLIMFKCRVSFSLHRLNVSKWKKQSIFTNQSSSFSIFTI